MSTIKVTNVSHPSAASPAIVLDAAGDATYAGTHDFTAATVTGAGKVLQVVQATTTATVSTTSTAYVTTGVTASITPSTATSKIMILSAVAARNNSGTAITYLTLFRGTVAGTNITSPDMFPIYGNMQVGQTLTYLDSPNTTSAQTYTVGFKVSSGGNASVNIYNSASNIILVEVSA